MSRLIAFRVDASLQIGTGHAMRCLSLADALTARGEDCQFICRTHEGNLIEYIRSKGYIAHALPVPDAGGDHSRPRTSAAPDAENPYSQWLATTQAEDAEACSRILTPREADWLIVDHYALDVHWERGLKRHYRRLMVIDDLADRPHSCDLLLDQTFGREATEYRNLVPVNSRLLCGTQYALLRPEFANLRPYSLQRRERPVMRQLLITMGGVDIDNATGLVLKALRSCPLPAECCITVVMGPTAPWLEEIRTQADHMPWSTRVQVGVNNMAQLMADSDLAIGAAGATSWERCCLGVPTIMLVLADNQRTIADALDKSGAAKRISIDALTTREFHALLRALIEHPAQLQNMSRRAAVIVDGSGVNSVIREMAAHSE